MWTDGIKCVYNSHHPYRLAIEASPDMCCLVAISLFFPFATLYSSQKVRTQHKSGQWLDLFCRWWSINGTLNRSIQWARILVTVIPKEICVKPLPKVIPKAFIWLKTLTKPCCVRSIILSDGQQFKKALYCSSSLVCVLHLNTGHSSVGRRTCFDMIQMNVSEMLNYFVKPIHFFSLTLLYHCFFFCVFDNNISKM